MAEDANLSSWVAEVIEDGKKDINKEDDFCNEKEDDWRNSMDEDELYESLTPHLGLTPTQPDPMLKGSLGMSGTIERRIGSPERIPEISLASPVEGYGDGITLGGATALPDDTLAYIEGVEDIPFEVTGLEVLTYPDEYKLSDNSEEHTGSKNRQTDRQEGLTKNILYMSTPAPPVKDSSHHNSGKLSFRHYVNPICLANYDDQEGPQHSDDPPPTRMTSPVQWFRTYCLV